MHSTDVTRIREVKKEKVLRKYLWKLLGNKSISVSHNPLLNTPICMKRFGVRTGICELILLPLTTSPSSLRVKINVRKIILTFPLNQYTSQYELLLDDN